MKNGNRKKDLIEYISRCLKEKWEKNDIVSYSVIHDFYRHLIDAESRSNSLVLQLERSSV